MKLLIQLKAIFVFAAMMTGVQIYAQDTVIPSGELPKTSQQFISKNFGKQKISQAQKESIAGIAKDYKVYLDNGTSIEFGRDGAWEEIENNQSGIPFSVAPATIQKYVKQKFPGTFIKKIEKKRFGYHVDISNGLELEFDSKGNFTRIDD
ncbi:PepSY-like domain-containing protein [Chryseobacterium sp.]|uniref:PepSY-like domain-containing protein n=1 Tax=Chryseobacterium sp. TaxID=1871047 RepID=UPI0025C6B1D0|nr:PepSY-like domain-containing protein [Chryseobacterium sp.]